MSLSGPESDSALKLCCGSKKKLCCLENTNMFLMLWFGDQLSGGAKTRWLQKLIWKNSVQGEADKKGQSGVKLKSWTPMAKWEGTGAARVHTERFVRWYGSSPFGDEGGAHV